MIEQARPAPFSLLVLSGIAARRLSFFRAELPPPARLFHFCRLSLRCHSLISLAPPADTVFITLPAFPSLPPRRYLVGKAECARTGTDRQGKGARGERREKDVSLNHHTRVPKQKPDIPFLWGFSFLSLSSLLFFSLALALSPPATCSPRWDTTRKLLVVGSCLGWS